MNLWDLRRNTQTGLALAQLKRPLIAIAIMCAVLWGSISGLEGLFIQINLPLSYRITEGLVVLISILIATVTYFVLLLRLKAVTKQDLLLIPGFESKVLPYIQKLHLL